MCCTLLSVFTLVNSCNAHKQPPDVWSQVTVRWHQIAVKWHRSPVTALWHQIAWVQISASALLALQPWSSSEVSLNFGFLIYNREINIQMYNSKKLWKPKHFHILVVDSFCDKKQLLFLLVQYSYVLLQNYLWPVDYSMLPQTLLEGYKYMFYIP